MLFEFKRATVTDLDYLLALRKLTMQEHLKKSGLFLSEEEHIARVKYKYEYLNLVFLKSERIGAVKYHSLANVVEIIQIQIDPKQQNKGYGSALVLEIVNNAKEKAVELSVLKCNPAVSLYKRLGFQVVGENKDEYRMRYIRN